MTPEEHYLKADDYMLQVEKLGEGSYNVDTWNFIHQSQVRLTARAHVHALLAQCRRGLTEEVDI